MTREECDAHNAAVWAGHATQAAEAERAKVVAWLREQYIVVGFAKVYVGRDLADAIEARAHLGAEA
jgi:hypothetical protein